MKKLLFIAAICAILWATSDKPGVIDTPKSATYITVHTPSLTKIQGCFEEIVTALRTLAVDFSIEQTTTDSTEDVYTIYIG